MKKFAFILIFLMSFSLLPNFVKADTDAKLNIYLFYGESCPHCAKEMEVLEYFKNQYPEIKFYYYEIYNHPENALLMQKSAETLSVFANGVPFSIIGDKPFIGFSESHSPQMLEERIKECLANSCPDSLSSVLNVPPARLDIEVTEKSQEPTSSVFNIPVLGEVEAKTVSLPFLSVVMGVLDGFNPCAMWTLLFLISLLLGMENRKRMWLLGSVFIISSAAVYFLFMAAWLNLVLFIGFVFWVRIAIGALAIGGGAYSLKKFFTSKSGTCEIVEGNEKREMVFEKLKDFTRQKSLWLALLGIAALAIAVNFVELVCSAGLPAVFTQILALNSLPKWQYYLYLLLYIFFFMIDDLFVFFAAMITLKITGLTNKYSRYSHLIGGILMFLIGLLLIFRPEWLMFG